MIAALIRDFIAVKPFDQYPKNVSLRAVEYMKESGIADRMIIGPEFEFYLLDSARFEGDGISHGCPSPPSSCTCGF